MDSPLVRALGLNIRRLRKERGFTQEALAERADIDVRHLQRVEAGEPDPQFTTLDKICRALGCDWNGMTEGIHGPQEAWTPMRTEQVHA